MRLTSLLTISSVVFILLGCGSPEERAAAHLEAAQDLFDEGDYVNAKLEARNAAQIQPKNADARFLLALIAEQDEQPREMWQHLLVAVNEDPELLDARLELGTLYVFAQAFDLASEQAAAAMELAPDNPDVQVLNARILIQQGETEQGIAALDAALALDPVHVEAVGMKALGLQENDPDAALALLDEAIAQIPADEAESLLRLKIDILAYHQRTQELEQALLAMIENAPEDDKTYQARLARFYREQGKMDAAEETLRELAADTTDDIRARLDVVQFLAEVRTADAAAETLLVFIEEDPDNQQLKLALGDLYQINEDDAAAVGIYQEVAAAEPLSEVGLLARAKLVADLIENGDTGGAMNMLTNILADAPDYPPALMMRASLFYQDERYDDAIADLRVLLRKEADHQNGLLLMARSHSRAGNTILAKDAYRQLVELNPDHVAATRELVAMMIQDNELDEAAALIARLTRDGSNNVDAALLMYDVLLRKQDWPAAEAEARRLAGGEDPNGVGAFLLGQVLEGQRQYAEAEAAFVQALAKRPDNVQMMQGLARSLKAQGKQQQMLAYLRERANENPNNPGIQLMLGGALAEQGETDEARQIFDAVIADFPTMSAAYAAIASLYPEDASERIAAWERGLEALPGDMIIGVNLAQEYQVAGRVDDLIPLYEDLLAHNPDNPLVANNLAELLANHRYQDPASLERAVQLADSLTDTDDPLIMDTVGWTYYRGGQHDRAVRYLERAVAGTTPMPVMRYHLGMAYLAAGNRVGARQELEKAVNQTGAQFDGIEEARETLATLDDA